MLDILEKEILRLKRIGVKESEIVELVNRIYFVKSEIYCCNCKFNGDSIDDVIIDTSHNKEDKITFLLRCYYCNNDIKQCTIEAWDHKSFEEYRHLIITGLQENKFPDFIVEHIIEKLLRHHYYLRV